MGLRVAVVGATGNVGREMFNILEERLFPISEIAAVASRRSVGKEVSFGDKTLKCKDIEQFDFSGFDVVLMSAGGAVSKEWSPKIGAMNRRLCAGGDRQFQRLAHGPARAFGRAGSES